jgi:hypothetical protein
MACGCGEKFQRVFPATSSFAVYFDAKRKTAPVSWRADELAVCLCCGEIFAHVPDAPLTELRRDAAEAL